MLRLLQLQQIFYHHYIPLYAGIVNLDHRRHYRGL
jgi:hypothetical protein